MKTGQHSSKIVVIHGPNMNLLGFRTKGSQEHITLDKLNRRLRRTASKYELEIKIIQSNDEGQTVTTLQRMRNKIVGILLFPGPWQHSAHILKDTLEILSIPYVTVSVGEKENILKGIKNIEEKDIYKSSEKALKELRKLI